MIKMNQRAKLLLLTKKERKRYSSPRNYREWALSDTEAVQSLQNNGPYNQTSRN